MDGAEIVGARHRLTQREFAHSCVPYSCERNQQNRIHGPQFMLKIFARIMVKIFARSS
jgi:hypothetical protein